MEVIRSFDMVMWPNPLGEESVALIHSKTSANDVPRYGVLHGHQFGPILKNESQLSVEHKFISTMKIWCEAPWHVTSEENYFLQRVNQGIVSVIDFN